MKKTLLLIVTLFVSLVYSQEKTIVLDYVVDYVIPNKKKQTKDTISIGYEKTGKYLWTNYKELANEFSKALFKNNSKTVLANSNSNLILETETADIIFAFESDKNVMFFKVNLNTIIPIKNNDAMNEDIVLISEKTDQTTNILNKEYKNYALYPNTEPQSKIFATFDENLPVDNNILFQKFLELMIQKTNSEGSISSNLPKGLILKITDGNSSLIEAIKVHKVKKTININYSFKVKE